MPITSALGLMPLSASQCMVWLALEALVTEGVSGPARANIVGVYSVVWATCSALSYFLAAAFSNGWEAPASSGCHQ